MGNIIYYGTMLIIAVLTFVIGKYIVPNAKVDQLVQMEQWANKFVLWAQ